MHIPVHSPWLPGYMDVRQIVLIILTMAGLFLDRPRILMFILTCTVFLNLLLIVKFISYAEYMEDLQIYIEIKDKI